MTELKSVVNNIVRADIEHFDNGTAEICAVGLVQDSATVGLEGARVYQV